MASIKTNFIIQQSTKKCHKIYFIYKLLSGVDKTNASMYSHDNHNRMYSAKKNCHNYFDKTHQLICNNNLDIFCFCAFQGHRELKTHRWVNAIHTNATVMRWCIKIGCCVCVLGSRFLACSKSLSLLRCAHHISFGLIFACAPPQPSPAQRPFSVTAHKIIEPRVNGSKPVTFA